MKEMDSNIKNKINGEIIAIQKRLEYLMRLVSKPELKHGDIFQCRRSDELRMIVIDKKKSGIMYLKSSQYNAGSFIDIISYNSNSGIALNTNNYEDIYKYINDHQNYKFVGNIFSLLEIHGNLNKGDK